MGYNRKILEMEVTLDQALQKGVAAHKAGKVQEADRYYTAILKANPKHPDANHNMGVLAVGVSKVEAALPFFKTAVEANPNIAQYWLSYIDALITLERLEDAKALFEQSKGKGLKGGAFEKLKQRLDTTSVTRINVQDPPSDQQQALINLYSQGHYKKTLTQASKVLHQFPNSINLYNIIGAANKGLGKPDEAIQAFKKALSIKPDCAEALSNTGTILYEQGKLSEAIKAYIKAISIKPDYAEAYYNLGIALQDQSKLDEAIEALNKALSIKPDYAEAYNKMGAALQDQGKHEDAIKAYIKAISIKPDFVEAHNNMGNVLQNQGKLEEAIEAYKKALTIKPDFAEAYNNTTELLKTFSPKIERSLTVFNIDGKIKKLSPAILHATSNKELINSLLEGLSYISEDSFEYKTPLSQIYKRNTVDLNCKRHKKIFDTIEIIPEFCFDCFKVQVEVGTFLDLIKLTSLFYKFDFKEDLTKKTIIELRPNISGYYKGLIYCRGLDHANKVKDSLDIRLKGSFNGTIMSNVKRGCSEYPLKFPKFGKIPTKNREIMKFPREWKQHENQFDQDELIKPKPNNKNKSLQEFCLSDFYIIQKWIDYAKGIRDQSIEAFNDRPIIFEDIYAIAKMRSMT